MKRYLPIMLAVLAACAGTTMTETGPKISIDVSDSHTFVRSQSLSSKTEPFELRSTETEYSITVDLDARDGTEETKNASSANQPGTFPAQTVKVDLSVDGAAVGSPKLTSKTTGGTASYTSEVVKIPATSKGKTLTVHAEASDSRGLRSNVIDLKIDLK